MGLDVMNNAQNVEKQPFSGLASIFGRNDPPSSCHHLLAHHVHVGQSEEHLPLTLVLGDAAIVSFSMPKEIRGWLISYDG